MGNRGAKLEVELTRERYHVGDVITGSLILYANKTVVCKGLTVVLEGAEQLAVAEPDGKVSSKNVFFLDKILSKSDHQSYDPSCYRFPFKYEIQADLPGQFDRAGAVGAYQMQLHYGFTIKAMLQAGKKMGWTVQTSKPIAVIKPQDDMEPQSVNESVCKEVFVRFQKETVGICHIAATMDRDVQTEGQSVCVRWTVTNDTSKEISSVSLGLHSTYSSRSNIGRGQETVINNSLAPVCAGKSAEFEMDLVLAKWYGGNRGGAMMVTTQTSLLIVKFFVVIKCHYQLGKSVSLEMPLRILAAPE